MALSNRPASDSSMTLRLHFRPKPSFASALRRLAVALLAAPLFAQADPETVKEISRTVHGYPFRAYVLPVAHEDRLAIRALDPRDLAEFSLLSQDGQQGGHVENIQWSKDAQFLVCSTTSSGGHSPWNYRTYVFSTLRWEFLSLDESATLVTSPDFSFTDPTHLSVEALKTASSATDDVERRTIDLEALPWKKPKSRKPPEE
jgi:hypothetical protein